MEATFQEVRQRLGFETQRQWSEKTIRGSVAAVWACRVKVAPIGAITARASLGEC